MSIERKFTADDIGKPALSLVDENRWCHESRISAVTNDGDWVALDNIPDGPLRRFWHWWWDGNTVEWYRSDLCRLVTKGKAVVEA